MYLTIRFWKSFYLFLHMRLFIPIKCDLLQQKVLDIKAIYTITNVKQYFRCLPYENHKKINYPIISLRKCDQFRALKLCTNCCGTKYCIIHISNHFAYHFFSVLRTRNIYWNIFGRISFIHKSRKTIKKMCYMVISMSTVWRKAGNI